MERLLGTGRKQARSVSNRIGWQNKHRVTGKKGATVKNNILKYSE